MKVYQIFEREVATGNIYLIFSCLDLATAEIAMNVLRVDRPISKVWDRSLHSNPIAGGFHYGFPEFKNDML